MHEVIPIMLGIAVGVSIAGVMFVIYMVTMTEEYDLAADLDIESKRAADEAKADELARKEGRVVINIGQHK